MKKSIATVFIIMFIFTFLSCGRKVNEQESSRTAEKTEAGSEAITEQEPELKPETAAADETAEEPEQAVVTEEAEKPVEKPEPTAQLKPVIDYTKPPPASELTKGAVTKPEPVSEPEPEPEDTPVAETTPEPVVQEAPAPVITAPEPEPESEPEIEPVKLPEPLPEKISEPEQLAVPEKIIDIELSETPQASIESPVFGDTYKGTVTVQGYFSGFSGFKKAEWSVAGTDLSGTLPEENNRAFSFDIDTAGLRSSIVVKVSAEDLNKKKAEDILVLLDDNRGPDLNILSPKNNSVYTAQSVITGQASGAEILEAEITGSGLPYPVEVKASGYFELPVEELIISSGKAGDSSNTIIIKFTASDSNDNTSTDFICLYKKDPGYNFDISSHSDGDLFGDETILSGTAENISSFNWEIEGTGLSGSARVNNNGFTIPVIISDVNDCILFRIFNDSAQKLNSTITTLKLYNDGKAPDLDITNPLPSSYYTDNISLLGRVFNKEAGAIDHIKELKWSIPGTSSQDNLIFFDDTGNFDINLYTADYTGLLPLQITATDFNNNISDKVFKLQDGKIKPEIKLLSPLPGSEFGAFIQLSGTIIDPYRDTPFEGIRKVSYEILSSEDYNSEPLSGSLDISDTGNFSLQIPALKIGYDQQVTLSVDAVNGNSNQKTFNISKSSNDIPSFTLSAGSSSVTADWTPVQTDSEYSLVIKEDPGPGETVNPLTYSDVNPPIRIPNLKNGSLYHLILNAELDSGMISSADKTVIPSDYRTFNLKADNDFKKIRLQWNSIRGASSYNIYRSLSGNEGFTLLASDYAGTEYIDRSILFGKSYDYFISAFKHEYAKSGTVSAEMINAPAQKLELYSSRYGFTPEEILIDGEYGYIAAGADGFFIVDLTEPEDFVITGAVPDLYCEAAAVNGDYAYLACGESGLSVINILNPAEPFFVGSQFCNNAVDITVESEHAFVADEGYGIRIFDISDSVNPFKLTPITGIDSSVISVRNNQLFTDNGNSIEIYNVSNISSPQKMSSFENINVQDMDISDEKCFLLTDTGLSILDISDIQTPELISELKIRTPDSFSVNGDFCFITQKTNGLSIVDISNPEKPITAERLQNSSFTALDIINNYIITAADGKLSAVHTFLKGASFSINEFPLTESPASIFIYDNHLFINSPMNGIDIFSLRAPSSPLKISQNFPIENTGKMLIYDNELYITEPSGRLTVFKVQNISNTFSFTKHKTIELGSDILFLDKTEEPDNKIIISAITENGNVFLIDRDGSSVGISSGNPRSTAVSGEAVYIADSDNGLQIYDLSNAGSPDLSSTIKINKAGFQVCSENLLLVNSDTGIRLYDISNKLNPLLKSIIKTDYAEKALIRKKYLYIAEGYRGLTVYDISDPENPKLISSCDSVYASDLAIDGEYAFIDDGTGINTVRIFIPDWLK